jgi:hypothetical protein
MHPPSSQQPPNKAGLKAWWANFTSAQKAKKEAEARRGERCNIVNNSSSAHPRRLSRGTGARRLRETSEREFKVCKRTNIDRKLQRGTLRMGLYTCRRG